MTTQPLGIGALKALVLFAAALQLGYKKVMADGHFGIWDTPTVLGLMPETFDAAPHFKQAVPELLDMDQGEAIDLVAAVQEKFGHMLPPGSNADMITAAALKMVPPLVALIRACTLDGPPVAQIVEPAPGLTLEETATASPPAAEPGTEAPPAGDGPGDRGEGV